MTDSIDFATVGLLGSGTIGAAIAQVMSASGRRVVALEVEDARAGASRATIGTGDMAGVDLVIVAAGRDVALQRSLLADVAAVVGERTPIVTATSASSVTELAAAVPHPQRVAGLHFCTPPRMRTVEVVPGLRSDGELVDRLVALVESLDGVVAVTVRDRPGFLVDALLMPYLNDVVNEYDAGLATAEDLDVALELGLGYPAGPMAMLDLIGLDTHLRATEAVHAATGDARYAPPPLLRRMVAAGRLGARNGHGFRIGPDHDGP